MVQSRHRLDDATEQAELTVAVQAAEGGVVEGKGTFRIDLQHINCNVGQGPLARGPFLPNEVGKVSPFHGDGGVMIFRTQNR